MLRRDRERVKSGTISEKEAKAAAEKSALATLLEATEEDLGKLES